MRVNCLLRIIVRRIYMVDEGAKGKIHHKITGNCPECGAPIFSPQVDRYALHSDEVYEPTSIKTCTCYPDEAPAIATG